MPTEFLTTKPILTSSFEVWNGYTINNHLVPKNIFTFLKEKKLTSKLSPTSVFTVGNLQATKRLTDILTVRSVFNFSKIDDNYANTEPDELPTPVTPNSKDFIMYNMNDVAYVRLP